MDKETKGLSEYGVHLLSGDIGENVDDAIEFIMEGNFNNVHNHLTLLVNSHGGFVADGFALVDVMFGSQIPVHTTGIGALASMGLSIFIAGAKGNRILTPNTLIMSHQWAGCRIGKQHELLASVKQDALVTEMVIRHYKKCTGLREKDVRKYLMPPSDVFLSAKEALKLGLCDHVREMG